LNDDMTLRRLSAGIAELEALPPLERARRALELFNAAQALLPAVRQDAIHLMCSERTHAQVAADLGVSRAAVSMAVGSYLRRAGAVAA
jgi:hypothetical protein